MDDVSLVENVDLLVVVDDGVPNGPPVHSTKYLLPKGLLLYTSKFKQHLIIVIGYSELSSYWMTADSTIL